MDHKMQSKLEDKLFLTADNGNLENFKQIMEDSNLRQYINIAENGYQTLKAAASHCNEEFLDYILTIPEVTDEVMTKVVSYAFAQACKKGNFDIIYFYKENEKYKNYLNLTYNFNYCFRMAYQNNQNDVLQFLIIDMNLPKSEDILSEINNVYGDKDFVNRLFDKRDMKNELDKNLSIQDNVAKIIKKM